MERFSALTWRRGSVDGVRDPEVAAIASQLNHPEAVRATRIAVPDQRRPSQTILGEIRFVERHIDKLDTVRVETDLGPGWATSVEQTALDLCGDRPA